MLPFALRRLTAAWLSGAVLSGSALCAQPAAKPESGLARENMDPAVRAQDDLYAHVNGKWLAAAVVPADRGSSGEFAALQEGIALQLRAIVEQAAAKPKATGDVARIGKLYASFMDEARLEQLGVAPLQEQLAAIAAVSDIKELPILFARSIRNGIAAPIELGIHQDNRNATRYVADFSQGGLGLPDRALYLNPGDPGRAAMLAKYQQHIAAMLALAGDSMAAASARHIVALETELARAQWGAQELRDPVKGYNPYGMSRLAGLTPQFDWVAYLAALRVTGRADMFIVGQPSYLQRLSSIIAATPLDVWKAYFTWQTVRKFAPCLPQAFVDEHYAFYSVHLGGARAMRPRWRRGLAVVERAMGEALGKLYVEQHFPPAQQQRADQMVAHLLAATRQYLEGAAWMQPATRQQALAKLAKLSVKVGAPAVWHSDTALEIRPDDLLGNVLRASQAGFDRDIAKLDQLVDRTEWGLTPQTVNGYSNPEKNEVVFTAAMLSPPFFNPKAEDAANYGAIGAMIAHEMTHGFDVQGSAYDGDGNLKYWWREEDYPAFMQRYQALVAQYNAYSPIEGYHVNGDMTLEENIGDSLGLAIAHRAYRLSLQGRPAPVIDGYTGDQRFYMAYAQAWRSRMRDQEVIHRLKHDPHAPARYRANGALSNQPGFYDAFGVKPGDRMYVAPEKRIRLW